MRSVHQSLLFAGVFMFAAVASWSGENAAAAPKKEAPKRVVQQLKADRLVADNALLFASVPDVKKLMAAAERTSLRAMLREEDMSQTVLKSLTGIREAYIKGDGSRSDMELRRKTDEMDLLLKLLPYADGQASVAIETAGAEDTTDLPPFLIILSMPQGDSGDDRQRLLEDLMEKHRAAQCTDPRFKDFDDQIGPYIVTRVENNDLKLVEGWAFVENLFVYGQGKGVVERALERYTRGGQGTLALSAGYQSVFKEVGRDEKGESLAYAQGDIRPAIKKIGDMNRSLAIVLNVLFNPENEKLESTYPHYAVGVSIPEGANAPIREKIFLRTAKDLKSANMTPCTGVTARFVQSDALVYRALNLASPSKTLKYLLKTITKAPEGQLVSPEFRTALGGATDEEALAKLDVFKGEAGVALTYITQASSEAESIQDILEMLQPVFFLELDPENAVAHASVTQLLGSFEKTSKHQYMFTKVDAVEVYYQQGAAPREDKQGSGELGFFANVNAHSDGAPFFKSWARVDLNVDGKPRKFLLMSDSLNAVKKAVQQAQAQFARVSLAEDAQFKSFQTQFRDTRQSLTYVDMKKVVDSASLELSRLSRAMGWSRETIEQLPNLAVVKEYMSPMAMALSYTNDPEGAVIESTSPVGNVPLVAVAGAVAWPAVVKRQQEQISVETDSKFKRIQTALHLYAADFDRLPPNLSDLYEGYVKKENLKVFESPFRRGALKGSPQEIDNPDMTNLVYVPGRSLQGLGSDVILYEREPTKLFSNRDGTRLFHHVITVDGSRTWMTRAALERNLEGKVELKSTNVSDGVKAAPGGKSAPGKAAPPPVRRPRTK